MSSPTSKVNSGKVEVIVPRHRTPLVIKDNKEMVKVYVWEFPVRLFHWVNAFSIIVLMLTGIYIAHPFVSASIQEEAYFSFLMGWVRYFHFFTAFLFTVNLAVRWYWVFKGNIHATSNPLRKGFWKETLETIKFYLFLKNRKKHYIGHNPLAQLSYWLFIGGGSLIVMFTGYYMLFEPQPETVFGKFFSWVPFLFGNSFSIRSWHHFAAWGFMVFMVTHIYMAWREDYLQRNGTMSSIFTGYKSEPRHAVGDEHEQSPDAK